MKASLTKHSHSDALRYHSRYASHDFQLGIGHLVWFVVVHGNMPYILILFYTFRLFYWLLFVPYCLPFSTLAMALSHVMIRNFLFRGMKGWRDSQFVTICEDRAISRGHEKWGGGKKWPTLVGNQSLSKMHSLHLLLLLLYITLTTGGKSVILHHQPLTGKKDSTTEAILMVIKSCQILIKQCSLRKTWFLRRCRLKMNLF